jgi:hypothetical protein
MQASFNPLGQPLDQLAYRVRAEGRRASVGQQRLPRCANLILACTI